MNIKNKEQKRIKNITKDNKSHNNKEFKENNNQDS